MMRCLLALVLLGLASNLVAAQAPAGQVAAAEQFPFEKTIRAYRAGPIAENVQIRVKDDRGRERRSDVVVKIDAARPEVAGHGAQRAILARVELGDLAVSIEGDRLLATHRLEKNRDAEVPRPPGPLLEALSAVMPALVLPQLVLADRGTDRMQDLGVFFRPMAVQWEPGVVDRPTGKLMYAGTSGDTTLKMLVDRNTGRLASLQVASASGPIRSIDLTARPIPAGSPDTWAVDVVGRQRVDALADLAAESEQVRVGERFPPTMSLLTTGLSPWQEVRDDYASVLVFVPIDTTNLENPDPAIRDAAVARIKRETGVAALLVRRLEVGAKDRWVARNVGLVPPDSVRREITSIVLTVLNSTDSAVLSEPDNMPLIGVAQSFDYDPILGGGQGGIVVIDKTRTVRAILTLGDLESTEKKVREVLDTLGK